MNDTYSKEVIDLKFESIIAHLNEQDKVSADILGNVRKTNGRVTRLEKLALIIGAIVFTLLIVNASPFVNFLSAIIK